MLSELRKLYGLVSLTRGGNKSERYEGVRPFIILKKRTSLCFWNVALEGFPIQVRLRVFEYYKVWLLHLQFLLLRYE